MHSIGTTTRFVLADEKHKTMKVQIGRFQRRPMAIPDWGGSLNRTLIGHRETSEQVEVFHLLAWGENEMDAELMLKRNKT